MARWALISGEKGDDKSGVAREVVSRLKQRGVRVAGFLQQRRYDAQERKGYELLRLANGEHITLALGGVAARSPNEEALCEYAFRNDAFEQARRWLCEDGAQADLLVVDDVSKLETQGRGNAGSVTWALAQRDPVVLLCVRARQLFYVVENFGLDDEPVGALELASGGGSRERFVELIAAACAKRSPPEGPA